MRCVSFQTHLLGKGLHCDLSLPSVGAFWLSLQHWLWKHLGISFVGHKMAPSSYMSIHVHEEEWRLLSHQEAKF